jgi:predicted RNase H-like HicB family nuclease
MKLRLLVEFDPETKRWSAVFPELPGCASAGDTEEEAVRNAKEALELWFEPSEIKPAEGAKLLEVSILERPLSRSECEGRCPRIEAKWIRPKRSKGQSSRMASCQWPASDRRRARQQTDPEGNPQEHHRRKWPRC